MTTGSTAPKSLRSLGGNAFLALVGFVVVSLALSRFTGGTRSSVLGAKIDWFEQHRDEYTGLFVGSSVVYRSINPVVVDAELAKRGIESFSFNFGVAGMRGYEADAWMRRLLEDPPAKLEWVVIEATTWSGSLAQDEFTERLVAWHDLLATRTSVACSLEAPRPWKWRIATAWGHLTLFACRATSAGLGPSLVDRYRRSSRESELTEDRLDRHRGFRAVDMETKGSFEQRFDALRDDLADYERRLAQIDPGRAEPPAASRDDEDFHPWAHAAQVARLREAGIEPFYFLGPVLYSGASMYRAAETGLHAEILGYNSPGTFPEFYDLENRWDRLHVNARGARMFSIVLARDLADRLESARASGAGE